MRETKIIFSDAEIELLNSKEIWGHKQSLTSKLYYQLSAVHDEAKSKFENQLREILNVDNVKGKISKGENYCGSPFLILDYPNHFKHE
jgi:hypothetical protein